MGVSLFVFAFIAGPAFLGSFASPLEKKQISTDLDGNYIQDSIRKLTSLLDKLNELKKESDLNIETNAASEFDKPGKTRASQLRHPEASNLDRSPADKRGGTGAKIEASEVGGTGGYKHGGLGVGGTGGYKNGVGGTGGYRHDELGVGGTGGYKRDKLDGKKHQLLEVLEELLGE